MLETTAIERYLLTVKRASQARSKDIRMDVTDAIALAAEISIILAKLTKDVAQPVSLSMDGGYLLQPK